MRAVVFCGPTVDAATVRGFLPDADCRPPAAQGDVHAATLERPDVIALVDGVFLDLPSVWHREILAALDTGIPVWGAASMGALRAVECGRFGMVGVGRIVEAYRSGRYDPFADPFEDDDEVAVIHGPAELGSRPLSDAMVDLRETLARAGSAGAIDGAARDRLAAAMKALPFAERSFGRMVALATAGLGAGDAARLAEALGAHRCSQKREDALALLSTLRDAGPGIPQTGWTFERTLDWERFAARSRRPAISAGERAVLAALGRDPLLERSVRRRAAARLAALDLAPCGVDPASVLGEFRRARGLLARADLDDWAAENLLSAEDFARLLGEEAALGALADEVEPDRLARAMLDELRLSDRLEDLRVPGSPAAEGAS